MKSRRNRPSTHIPRRKALSPPVVDAWDQDLEPGETPAEVEEKEEESSASEDPGMQTSERKR